MLLLLFYSCSNPSWAWQATDIFSFTRIYYVNPNPTGKTAAITTLKAEQKAGKWQWKYELLYDGKSKITDSNITQATYSNDGKYIAYITHASNADSLNLVKISNNQKSQLISFTGSIDAFQWSPNSNSIAFVATPKVSRKNKNGLVDVNLQNPNSRLYLIPIGLNEAPKAITPDLYSISIAFNDKGFDWSSDGNSIAFSEQPQAGAHYSSQSKILIYNVKTGAIKTTPYLQTHFAANPLISPNNRYLAYRTNVATSNTDTILKNNIFNLNQICVTDLQTAKDTCLMDTDNQNATLIGWNAQSSALYAIDFYKSTGMRIYELSLDPKKAPKMISTQEGFIEPLTLSMNANHSTFGFGLESTNLAPEAYLSSVKNFKLIPLTHLNQATQPLGNIQDINWRSIDGKKIEGLLMTPANYDPMKKYPLVVWAHGGPIGAAWKRYLGGCDEYSNMIEPSSCWGNYLKSGWVVFAPNYRGSTGYGADFRLANYKDFGGNDYQDIQSGVDYLIAKNIADPAHLFFAGWSYGGYLANWTISQTTRYQAAVSGDGLTDLISFAGTSDIPFFASEYLGSYPWEDSFLYIKRSPLLYVNNIQTPLLFFSGQRDIRVPIEQSLEMYTALKNSNKQVSMYMLPEQGHVPQDPNLALAAMVEINHWFTEAIKKHAQ